MRKLFYMGLECYEARYTLQLQQWSEETFKRHGIDYVVVTGDVLSTDKQIVTGQVLDAHGRSYFGMSQMMNLVKLMKEGEVTSEDVVFFEDMFQPGIESLPYIMNQVSPEHRPKVFVRCLAQTIDPDDFVHSTGMMPWMSHYEQMVTKFATVLASSEEMVANMKIAGWNCPIYNISGLTFGKREVQSRVESIKPFDQRKNRVFFSARWDQEKQPWLYMELAESVMAERDDVEFALFQGGQLKSNHPNLVNYTRDFAKKHPSFKIYENLKKNEYYDLVNDSRVLFNCALQDWVSNTVSEADALGSNVLYPAYRSFPEIFRNDHERMYIPWSMEDAKQKLYKLLDAPHKNIGQISDWTNLTLDRCLDIMSGNGEQWRRNTKDYRIHV